MASALDWTYDAETGWPVLVDGSLARWLQAQADRQRARGVQLESTAARVARARAAGLSVAGAAAATPLAGVGALVGLLALATALPGGLVATNDRDRDGRPDHLYAPTAEEQVQRMVTYASLYRPLGLDLELQEGARYVIGVLGTDMWVWWVLHAVRLFGDQSNPATSLPGRWVQPEPIQRPALPGSGPLVRPV